MKFKPLDFSRIRTYPLRERANKVRAEKFASVWQKGGRFDTFLQSLPHILVGEDFRAVVTVIVEAVKRKKPVVICMGAHPIKCGLSHIFVDLMERDLLSCVAMNGAAAIHHFELAMISQTSEDVARGLEDGSFGMIDETGRQMNDALTKGVQLGQRAGAPLGSAMLLGKFPYKELSILHKGVAREIPVTVHITIGTDITHQYPSTNGAVLGESAYLDFH